ncbi:hypothetical protein [Streptomyces sp. NPDC001889]
MTGVTLAFVGEGNPSLVGDLGNPSLAGDLGNLGFVCEGDSAWSVT